MVDLIDRAALIKDALKKGRKVRVDKHTGFWPCVLVADIKEAPAVDAVEVVRCGACRFRGKLYASHLCQHPNALLSKVEEDDFCSYGVRRIDGSTDRC